MVSEFFINKFHNDIQEVMTIEKYGTKKSGEFVRESLKIIYIDFSHLAMIDSAS